MGDLWLLPGLILEEIDRVAGVVPQEMVGPAARLARRVHVGAAEEIGLDIHLLNLDLAGLDLLVNILVARIEAADMAAHGDDAGLLLHAEDALAVGERVGHRNLDEHVLARAHRELGLVGVDLGRARDDRRLDARLPQTLGEIGGPMRNLPLLGEGLGAFAPAAGDGHDLGAGDVLQRLHVARAEGALSRESDLHVFILI